MRTESTYRRKETLATFCIVAIAVVTSHTALAQQNIELPDFAVVDWSVAQVSNLVVRLETTGGSELVGGKQFRNQASTGTVINSQGMVLTAAYNLAHEPTTIFATYNDGQRVPMSVAARNTSRNVVLLKPIASNSAIARQFENTRFRFPPRSDLVVGQAAIAVGTSGNSNSEKNKTSLSLSMGIISSTNRIWGRALQTDANVSPTNYGGPLLDVQGQMLGLLLPASANATSVADGVEWYDSGIGFAVPFDELRLPEMAAGKNQASGVLGISFSKERGFASPTIVTEVKKGSAADSAGLKPGDLVLAINGIEVQLATQAKHQLGPLYAGDFVEFAVQREAKSLNLKATLGH